MDSVERERGAPACWGYLIAVRAGRSFDEAVQSQSTQVVGHSALTQLRFAARESIPSIAKIADRTAAVHRIRLRFGGRASSPPGRSVGFTRPLAEQGTNCRADKTNS